MQQRKRHDQSFGSTTANDGRGVVSRKLSLREREDQPVVLAPTENRTTFECRVVKVRPGATTRLRKETSFLT